MTVEAKMTLFFSSQDSEGWSESFYFSAATLIAVEDTMNTVIPLRAALMPSDFSIIYGRVSDVAIKGDSLQATGTTFPVVGTYSGAGDTLEANTALLVVSFATASIKNRIFMRGLTSDVVLAREYQAPSLFTTAFTSWADAIIAGGAVCRHRTAAGPPPVYSYTTTGNITVVLATARKPGRPFGLPVGRRRV